MRELVFLLEEASAKAMLNALLPRMLDARLTYRLIPFEGKQDLEKQLTRKIRAFQNPHARFIVLRDQDSQPDCTQLKQQLLSLCEAAGKSADCLVRIACRELETFYLADLLAVEQALGIKGLARQQASRKFKAPDGLGSPSRELKMLTGQCYEKVSGSRRIGEFLQIDNPRSPSFANLIKAIRRMERQLLSIPD